MSREPVPGGLLAALAGCQHVRGQSSFGGCDLVNGAVDGETFELGPGGAVHVESTTPRHFWNAGDEDLVLLALGGKDGYVERDGHLVDPADAERRASFGKG